MTKYFNNFLIFFMMFMMLISMTISNIYLNWMLMEISTMTYISLMILSNNNKNSAMLYYFISFLSSSLILISILYLNKSNLFKILLLINLLLKLNLIPFHNWFFLMSKSLSWMNLFLLMTILKFIPFQILFMTMNNNNFIIMIIMINLLMPPILALNKSSIKLIISYSSMYQTSIMFLIININYNIFINYFLLYILVTLILIMFLNYFNNLNTSNYLLMNKKMKFIFLFILLMNSFFPPMMTFMLKWLILESLFNLNLTQYYFIMLILMISSILMIYNYLNFIMNNLFEFNFKKMFMKKKKINNWFLILIYCILFFSMFMYIYYYL